MTIDVNDTESRPRPKSETAGRFADAQRSIVAENAKIMERLDGDAWACAGDLVTGGGAVFVIGSGRSGLAAQMAAMRLMHLGLEVHVAGEVTAPAITADDVLIAVSGSGTTGSVVAAATTATTVGASVIAVTIGGQSPLGEKADLVLAIPAADKQDHSATLTAQYAGSLFEQAVLLAFDALFHSLRNTRDQSAEALWLRHANLG